MLFDHTRSRKLSYDKHKAVEIFTMCFVTIVKKLIDIIEVKSLLRMIPEFVNFVVRC